MLTELDRPLVSLETRRRELLEELGALSEGELRFSASPTSWSQLEVGEHLMISERTVAAAIRRRPVGQRAARSARQGLMALALAVVFRLGLRVKAPSTALEPRGELDLNGLRREWGAVGRELRACLAAVSREEIEEVAFIHPVSGPLDFRHALRVLEAHFDHHRRQIERIRRASGYPAARSDGGGG